MASGKTNKQTAYPISIIFDKESKGKTLVTRKMVIGDFI